ncbi:MAG: HAMP domain-containing histidine kinase [Clostridium luticellarii]|nr:HAMP domain-containing sensor histidine kinase [Clostridium luticellarii]MCI1996776.1 HAMP domain-containing histidine kinase [Clostridium luticellarii]MCI2039627.1 HAMP domain-containing histidine kinase [Clostridium luticellarii]
MRKFFLKSVSRELIIINIFSFMVLVIGIAVSVQIIISDKNNTQNFVNASNDTYVQVVRYVKSTDLQNNYYIDNLAKLNNVNIAVADMKGSVILKSNAVKDRYMDLDSIREYMVKDHTGKTVYELYDLNISGNKYVLVTWKASGTYYEIFKHVYIIAFPIVISLGIIYFWSYKKARYIKYICKGIVKISQENLDCELEKRGSDELEILAEEINRMSFNLKNMMDREKSLQRFKNELITNMSHDLRTPLTSLIGYLYLLNDKNTSVSVKDREIYSKKSLERAKKLKLLIDNLFQYSKLESGEIEPELYNVNIVEIMEQIIGEMSILAKKSGIKFVKKYDMADIKLKVDPCLISRAFQNILSNAVKYSVKNSSVCIDITSDKESTVVSFQNKPIQSLSDKQIGKIFERFYMGDKSRNSHENNSGLGLAIVKNIVKLHEGEVWAENKDNTFKIYVRLRNDLLSKLK